MTNLHDKFVYKDGQLLSRKTGVAYRNKDRDGYIRVRFDNKEHRAHRIIWEMHNGYIPSGMLVDHIDGNTQNNYIDNLRLATRRQNNTNSISKGGLSKGITKVGDKYRARIMYNGEHYSLGTYNTLEEAEREYKEADIILNGNFSINSNVSTIFPTSHNYPQRP